MYVNNDHDIVHYLLTPIKELVLSGSVSGNMPLWFLVSLFVVQLIYSALSAKLNDMVLAFVAVFMAYLFYTFNVALPLYFQNVLLGLALYAMGHYFSELQYRRQTCVVSLMVYLTIMLLVPSSFDFRANEVTRGYYMCAVLFGLSGCIVINNFFKMIKWRFDILSYIGRKSMAFYVLHWLVLMLCKIAKDVFSIPGGVPYLTLLLLSCIIILPLTVELLTKAKFRYI